MGFIAGRQCRINGRDYQAREVVSTTGIRRFQTLVAARYLVPSPDDGEAAAGAPDLAEMTRADLNALAASKGVESPDKLRTKDDVIAAIDAASTPRPSIPEDAIDNAYAFYDADERVHGPDDFAAFSDAWGRALAGEEPSAEGNEATDGESSGDED